MENTGVPGRETSGESHYLWAPPGKPVAVRVAREAMDGILLEALSGLGRLSRGRGIEVGGILLGTAERDGARYLVRVEDFLPITCEHASGPSFVLSEKDREELRKALEQWKRAPDKRRYAVGLWRSHRSEQLALRSDDLEILAAYFPHPSDVALLIRPRGTGPAQAAFFIWEGGRIQSERSYGDFEVEGPIAPGAGRRTRGTGDGRDRATPTALTAQMDGQAPVEQESAASPLRAAPADARPQEEFRFSMYDARPHRPARRWILALVPLLALGVAGFLLTSHGLIRLPRRPAPKDPLTVSLGGQEQAGNLQISWDRSAPAITAARRARLTITDGDEIRTLELGPEQLRTGSVVYHRISDVVTVRLELVWDGRSLSETWTYRVPSPPQQVTTEIQPR